MTFWQYRSLLYADLYRISDSDTLGFWLLLKHVLSNYSFCYNFWLRTCAYTRGQPWLRYTVYIIARLALGHLKYKLGISIPYYTQIGHGFYIGHFGGIVVNGNSVIGRNCNISQGVTLGYANRGRNRGYPVLGNNVYIGPGAKIVGAVRIGNNVAIGANCVVTKDVPDGAVVVGIPGRVISRQGSAGYVERTDYAGRIKRFQ
jgi:serine O-acetyltransferase